MTVSLYDASIPSYVQMLSNLLHFMDKAEAHAKATGADVGSYVEARLAPDMHTFKGQIQLASDAAKSGAARLAGVAPPSMPDTETSWDELRARVTKTIDFVQSVDKAAVNGDPARTVELPLPSGKLTFTAAEFLLRFSLPNFHFHVVTAYDILRAQGVPLGKMDYLAGARQPVAA
jgi:hypothetical protein